MESNNSSLLSIIIPAYNVERYIKECLASIFSGISKEKLSLLEVIVVNDGSSDGTRAILESYENRGQIILLNQENRGQSNARNNGLRIAKGKYVMFVDSDDYLWNDSLSRLIDFLAANEDVDIVEYGFYERWGNSEDIADKLEVPDVTSGDGQSVFAAWTSERFFRALVWSRIVSRGLLMDNHIFFYEGIFHEDEEWCPRTFAYAAKVVFLPLHVYVYRIRHGSIMRSMSIKNYFDMLKVCDSLYNFAATPGFSKKYVNSLRSACASLYLASIAGVKAKGRYDEGLIKELKGRSCILDYSDKVKRRWLYQYAIKAFGIKGFYFLKYALKDYLFPKKS